MLTFGFCTLSSAVKIFRPAGPSENLPAIPISPPRDLHDRIQPVDETAPTTGGRSRGPPAPRSSRFSSSRVEPSSLERFEFFP